jgi:hypothetical protein
LRHEPGFGEADPFRSAQIHAVVIFPVSEVDSATTLFPWEVIDRHHPATNEEMRK